MRLTSKGERALEVAQPKRTCRLSIAVGRAVARFEVTIWFVVDADVVFLITVNMKRQWAQNV